MGWDEGIDMSMSILQTPGDQEPHCHLVFLAMECSLKTSLNSPGDLKELSPTRGSGGTLAKAEEGS